MSWKKTFVHLVTAVHLTEIEFCPGGKESPRKPPKSCKRTQLAFCTFLTYILGEKKDLKSLWGLFPSIFVN